MEDEQHADLLRKGVEVWNAWRKDNPDVRPQLRRADLGGAMLRGADLVASQLGGANLRAADLIGANLSSANLRGADFSGAYLNRAGLRRAYLRSALILQADLRKADLGGADLTGTQFNRADLRGARFSGAELLETVFANSNLTGAADLEHCQHHGPSVIDHRTLQRSPNLPLSFLRGCGLPDSLIDYLPSLLDQPIQFYTCFISYSSADGGFAKRLHADLQNAGVRCWFAPEDMKIGEKIRARIDEVIRVHDKFLLVLSDSSVASTWVEKEAETAFAKELERGATVLFPIRLDDAVMNSDTGWAADIRRSRHIGDFTKWKEHDAYEESLKRLLRDLRSDEEAGQTNGKR